MMGWMRQYGYISADLFWLNPSDNDADWQCTLNRHDIRSLLLLLLLLLML